MTGMAHMAGDCLTHSAGFMYLRLLFPLSAGFSGFLHVTSAGDEMSKMASFLPRLSSARAGMTETCWAGQLWCHLCSSNCATSQDGRPRGGRLSWWLTSLGSSVLRVMVEAAKLLYDLVLEVLECHCLWILLAKQVMASSGSRGQELPSPFLMGAEAEDLWLSLIYHRCHTGWLSGASDSWKVSWVPPGLRFILSNVWKSCFSSGCQWENLGKGDDQPV